MRILLAALLLLAGSSIAAQSPDNDLNVYCQEAQLADTASFLQTSWLLFDRMVDEAEMSSMLIDVVKVLRSLDHALGRIVAQCTGTAILSETYDQDAGQPVSLKQDKYLVEVETPSDITLRLMPAQGASCEPATVEIAAVPGQARNWALVAFDSSCVFSAFVDTDAPAWRVYLQRLPTGPIDAGGD